MYFETSDYKSGLRLIRDYVREPSVLHPIKTILYDTQDVNLLIDLVNKIPNIESNQKRSEITALLQRMKDSRYICEIGTKYGGTLLLFMLFGHPDATIVSVDVNNSALLQRRLNILKRPEQKVRLLQADSQLEDTKNKVQKFLKNNQLDFLFIDGDHSYEGVKRDLELYNDLVKNEGIIALHDIEESYGLKYGQETRADVGGVPQYWQELLSQKYISEQFVEGEDQDGFGIGIIHWRV